ncbi:MAG: hypothetical protein IPM74_09300 [Crocinitomicaceae bacterium]|nr:hypothetical protein [Crocinitomicaceae bacterium]MBK8926088.1 hypothetical protein [Crocinitomicaceae bacterium]
MTKDFIDTEFDNLMTEDGFVDLGSVTISFENNIAWIVTREFAEISAEDMQKQMDVCAAYYPIDNFGVLVDASKYCVISNQAKSMLASSVYKNRKAIAIVSGSLPLRILANFYISVFKPNTPTRLFKNVVESEKWLNTMLSQ